MSKCVSDKGTGIRKARRWQRFWGLRFGGSVESAAAVQGTNCEDTHALAPCNLEPEARGGRGEALESARIRLQRSIHPNSVTVQSRAVPCRHHAEQHETSSSALTNGLMIPERVRSYGSHLGCMGCFNRRRNMEDTSAKADNMGKALDLMGVVGAASWLLHVRFAVAWVHVPEERFTSSNNGYSSQK